MPTQFTLFGINYYLHNGQFYADNMTVREVIQPSIFFALQVDYLTLSN